jgi:hypothetical protein
MHVHVHVAMHTQLKHYVYLPFGSSAVLQKGNLYVVKEVSGGSEVYRQAHILLFPRDILRLLLSYDNGRKESGNQFTLKGLTYITPR